MPGFRCPPSCLTGAGEVFAKVGDTHVRVYEWVDIGPPDKGLDPGEVGRLVAAMHSVPFTGRRPEDPWYTDPVGAPAWDRLIEELIGGTCTVRRRHGGDA